MGCKKAKSFKSSSYLALKVLRYGKHKSVNAIRASARVASGVGSTVATTSRRTAEAVRLQRVMGQIRKSQQGGRSLSKAASNAYRNVAQRIGEAQARRTVGNASAVRKRAMEAKATVQAERRAREAMGTLEDKRKRLAAYKKSIGR